MAVRPILRLGNPDLLKVSAPVADPTAPEIRALVQDMRDTLDDVQGIGLAAPQISQPLRVVLYCLPQHRIPSGAKAQPIPWTAMINPVIEPMGDDKRVMWERCLSLPGLYAKVPRYNEIVIRYSTLEGKQIEQHWQGYVAMLLQHECDHLDGVLYPMRMENPMDMAFASEMTGKGGVFSYDPNEFDG
ncbi:peptide deformylase [Ferrovibrio sp.]|uniref:peptide deformylase n=1 Tax=Ferrovibrio sp. TaxID=1917215 RepID=UPI0035B49BC1